MSRTSVDKEGHGSASVRGTPSSVLSTSTAEALAQHCSADRRKGRVNPALQMRKLFNFHLLLAYFYQSHLLLGALEDAALDSSLAKVVNTHVYSVMEKVAFKRLKCKSSMDVDALMKALSTCLPRPRSTRRDSDGNSLVILYLEHINVLSRDCQDLLCQMMTHNNWLLRTDDGSLLECRYEVFVIATVSNRRGELRLGCVGEVQDDLLDCFFTMLQPKDVFDAQGAATSRSQSLALDTVELFNAGPPPLLPDQLEEIASQLTAIQVSPGIHFRLQRIRIAVERYGVDGLMLLPQSGPVLLGAVTFCALTCGRSFVTPREIATVMPGTLLHRMIFSDFNDATKRVDVNRAALVLAAL